MWDISFRQAAEVIRRQSKSRDPSASAESSIKLQHAETRLNELKSSMVALGRVATDAMLSVEAQQQRITFQKLCTMVFLFSFRFICVCWHAYTGIPKYF